VTNFFPFEVTKVFDQQIEPILPCGPLLVKGSLINIMYYLLSRSPHRTAVFAAQPGHHFGHVGCPLGAGSFGQWLEETICFHNLFSNTTILPCCTKSLKRTGTTSYLNSSLTITLGP